MAFIVAKKVKGKNYYYLRESKREGDKVKSVYLAYLGKNKDDAEKKAKELIKKMESKENNVVRNLKKSDLTIDELANFCKRKGFVFSSGEIYGGLAGFWDFGPLGVEFKKNIKDSWWNYHVRGREDVVGIDGSIVTHPKVWEASGHVESFVDLAVECKKCKNKSKVDKHEFGKVKCEKCEGEFESKGEFNPMFATQVGPIADDSLKSYLRPETAQLIFADFKSVLDTSRLKFPFGIAQIGKSFRNEIAPRNFLFRSREFEQMELEYFIDPDEVKNCPYLEEVLDFELNVYSAKMQENNFPAVKMKIKDALDKKIIMLSWHGYWLAVELKWFFSLGVNPDNFRIRQHLAEEKSHYAVDTWDLEYKFPFGWKELEGIADRGQFDLTQHEKYSKKELRVFDEDKKKKILPMVVSEPSMGVERAFLVFLFDSYYKNEKGDVVLKIDSKLAPVKVAIFPIVKQKEFVDVAQNIFNDLKKEWNVVYDKSGSIGRRYARNDEIGTPYCITIDGDSIKNKDVTIRDRDTTKQVRVKVNGLKNILRDLISGEIKFESL